MGCQATTRAVVDAYSRPWTGTGLHELVDQELTEETSMPVPEFAGWGVGRGSRGAAAVPERKKDHLLQRKDMNFPDVQEQASIDRVPPDGIGVFYRILGATPPPLQCHHSLSEEKKSQGLRGATKNAPVVAFFHLRKSLRKIV